MGKHILLLPLVLSLLMSSLQDSCGHEPS
uniref:3' non-translated beta-F1-ATPase mRNA-binding protein n=1 Tax=Rattus norvegicus TaxID=10116 RepID=Q91XP0_RAT|nr:3' non-translated beta-F1-ATPase mRNA-binding protein [Rattus norvegicus]